MNHPFIITFSIAFYVSSITQLWTEREWTQHIAESIENSRVEVVQFDNTRIDIESDQYAIEVDWADKWAEGVGQSLYYAKLTGKKPVLLLLTKNDWRDSRVYVFRALTAMPELGHVWIYDTANDRWIKNSMIARDP